MAGISELETDAALAGGVRIRQATAGDAEFLGWVMLTAARSHLEVGIWEYINGQTGDQTLEYLRRLAVTETEHWCHWSRFLIAEVDGHPAAAMCGFEPEAHGMHVMLEVLPAVLEASGITEADFPGLMERGAVVTAVNSDYAEGAWVVENVATVPGYRRRGLVDALLARILADGRALGYPRAQISVLIGNEPARNAYLKAGFEPDSEKRSPEFEAALGSPGLERLLQPLLA